MKIDLKSLRVRGYSVDYDEQREVIHIRADHGAPISEILDCSTIERSLRECGMRRADAIAMVEGFLEEAESKIIWAAIME